MLASRNYAPSPDLMPFVKRHYVFAAPLPEDFELVDSLLSETAFLRILIQGNWTARLDGDSWSSAGPVVLFGPNARPLPVKVRGPFIVAGTALRPSGWKALFTEAASSFTDGMLPLADVWGEIADQLWQEVASAGDDTAIVAAIEKAITARLLQVGNYSHDLEMARLEEIALSDSTRRIEDIAEELGLSVRQLERRCQASFGLSPKQLLRRSRFLDMAAAMRDFTHPSEEELLALRYFDDSHRSREFKRFSGMTPAQFRDASTPLLTAGLKLRAEANAILRAQLAQIEV